MDQQVIKTLKENGYKVYAVKDKDKLSNEDGYSYGNYVFAISPSDNVLYVQAAYFGGYEVSLQYVPSRKNGSGCRANDVQPYPNITLDVMVSAERENLAFANKLGAQLYKSSDAWKRTYWTELFEL